MQTKTFGRKNVKPVVKAAPVNIVKVTDAEHNRQVLLDYALDKLPMIGLGAAGALALAAVSISLEPSAEAQMFSNAKAAVAYNLRDPDSARFRNVRLSHTGDAVVGCYTGKNGFNGYGDWKGFFYYNGTVDLNHSAGC